MKKLVYINACIRGEESRTGKLAAAMLEVLGKRYDITEINISNMDLGCVTANEFNRRKHTGIPEEDMHYGNIIANADRIVVAAPFWDMSFPAVLKAFIEHMCAPGLTFKYNPNGSDQGICKAEKMLYITTRGGFTETGSPLDQGTSYLNAICWLWGIPHLETIAVTGTDVHSPEELQKKMAEAVEKGKNMCKEF
jgi:FMN-dependent NADH-azoreductase